MVRQDAQLDPTKAKDTSTQRSLGLICGGLFSLLNRVVLACIRLKGLVLGLINHFDSPKQSFLSLGKTRGGGAPWTRPFCRIGGYGSEKLRQFTVWIAWQAVMQMSKRLTQLAQHRRELWNFLSWEKQKNGARLALNSQTDSLSSRNRGGVLAV